MSNLVRYTTVTFALLLACAGAHAGHHEGLCPKLTGPSEQKLKLTVDEYHLSLNNKKPICIVMGGSVKLDIKVPGNSPIELKAGDVTAEQKDGSPFKIAGENKEGDVMHLTLSISEFDTDPGDDDECGDDSEDECGKFWIKVKGVGKLDPRVRVVDGSVEMGHQKIILQEVLDDLELTIEEAAEVLNYDSAGAE